MNKDHIYYELFLASLKFAIDVRLDKTSSEEDIKGADNLIEQLCKTFK